MKTPPRSTRPPWARFTVDLWRDIDAEWTQPTRLNDNRTPLVLVSVAVALTIQRYLGSRSTYAMLVPDHGGEYWELGSFAWWTGWRIVTYVVIPLVVIASLRGERPRDYFLRARGLVSKSWIYLSLYLLILPAVFLASTTTAFQNTYPFYSLANRSSLDFWAWQLMYWAQFVALEFFFRGYMLRSLAPRFGSAAIFVMVVPYCMIHFGKPLPETLAAIVAGVILGTLALRTKSIWGGALLHIAVALTMDALAVGHCPPASSGLPCSPR